MVGAVGKFNLPLAMAVMQRAAKASSAVRPEADAFLVEALSVLGMKEALWPTAWQSAGMAEFIPPEVRAWVAEREALPPSQGLRAGQSSAATVGVRGVVREGWDVRTTVGHADGTLGQWVTRFPT